MEHDWDEVNSKCRMCGVTRELLALIGMPARECEPMPEPVQTTSIFGPVVKTYQIPDAYMKALLGDGADESIVVEAKP